ncbi:hypothetical protein OG618_08530 [Kitasatospora sp. NBC_01246]|uniref:hypothetical protein n=1 Tax=Kitasatospora sp. NBC_01246 TaxID=2903570 RepID=UPI002E3371E4|nr:hypothetical protein [Kitasatospora sp. NBC_01246]
MTWKFATSRIGHDGAGALTLEVCHRRADYGNRFGGMFWLSSPPLPVQSPELEVFCPVCTADRGLTVSGVWGGPAQLTCVCGHSWTPHLPGLTPELLLRALVRLALSSNPGPGVPLWRMRADHDAEPPTPLQQTVRPYLVEAGRALNRREWVFTEDEGRVAADVLTRAGCTVYRNVSELPVEEQSDEARLAWVRDNLQVLEDHSRAAGGRLGTFMSDCAAALSPAAALTMDDLEPGTTWSGLPPVLDDALRALGAVHVVLVAGATGDVDY